MMLRRALLFAFTLVFVGPLAAQAQDWQVRADRSQNAGDPDDTPELEFSAMGTTGECPTGSRKSAATVNTSYPTFCISAMLSSSRSRCAFSIQRCS